jgi:predicted RNase H-like nuclease (RuvC/YqgF family)
MKITAADLKTFFEQGVAACNAVIESETHVKEHEHLKSENANLARKNAELQSAALALEKKLQQQKQTATEWETKYQQYATVERLELRAKELQQMITEKEAHVRAVNKQLSEIEQRVSAMG